MQQAAYSLTEVIELDICLIGCVAGQLPEQGITLRYHKCHVVDTTPAVVPAVGAVVTGGVGRIAPALFGVFKLAHCSAILRSFANKDTTFF